MLTFSNVLDFLAYELSSLGGGRFPFARVPPGTLERLFFRHDNLLSATDVA